MTLNPDTVDPAHDEDSEDALSERAYTAFRQGALREASRLFGLLLEQRPDNPNLHYMRGLAHKYLREWPASLQHNLQAQQVQDDFDESSAWNAGIAATALGDWAEARRQWASCGIALPDGDGPIERDFGMISVRLNPWGDGETVFARRIDVVRARLLNVPLPESGHRLYDIVLHDGAKTGERQLDDGTVPVFNVLQTLETSDYRTHAVFVRSPSHEALAELLEAELPGIGYVEDWTASLVHLCLRCSFGVPHDRDAVDHVHDPNVASNDDWQVERSLGIAAQGKASVERLLANWVAGGDDRYVDGIESREFPAEGPQEGQVWWLDPTEEA